MCFGEYNTYINTAVLKLAQRLHTSGLCGAGFRWRRRSFDAALPVAPPERSEERQEVITARNGTHWQPETGVFDVAGTVAARLLAAAPAAAASARSPFFEQEAEAELHWPRSAHRPRPPRNDVTRGQTATQALAASEADQPA